MKTIKRIVLGFIFATLMLTFNNCAITVSSPAAVPVMSGPNADINLVEFNSMETSVVNDVAAK